ncbi:hypothetical protein HPB50_028231 [Hyalomma asiaticum]|nr:hypothetical protein HPB50_028231 [Hyalomma asiaticum]
MARAGASPCRLASFKFKEPDNPPLPEGNLRARRPSPTVAPQCRNVDRPAVTVEIKKIGVMVSKGLKTALGLPNSTSNKKREQLGLHNTVEVFEAQRAKEGQSAGARKQRKKKHKTHALFVDAARHHDRQAFAVAVVDIDGTLRNAATVKTRHAHEAEEMPVALALQSCRAHSIIYTDSKTAARTFAAGLVARSTAKLTDNAIREYESKRSIPGLDHCNTNEEVNRLERELTRLAADNDAYKGSREIRWRCRNAGRPRGWEDQVDVIPTVSLQVREGTRRRVDFPKCNPDSEVCSSAPGLIRECREPADVEKPPR